ncbi:hypothetical protein N866_04370 [Actinotalea ferrariae CF5-4]|uniref:Uncharacterized protein n=1 Tax=Actinotalea ferrariae CF5-4 TaxID=948458 RepID=A0A021VUI6_9CELL|nr:hypothetical protein [Actinotalea ferrariae]EYR64816.1 hypothetical protein N866_04370 [Actinotalea ferrariae CF5-4]
MSADDVTLPPTAVLLTQVAHAEALAAACALGKVAVDVVPSDIGAIAVCRDATGEQPERAAATVSKALANTMVVLLVHRGGRMAGSRWSAGSRGDDVSAVLMLDGAPPVVEQLLLGQAAAGDLPDVVSSVGMSRWRAARTLTAAARARRRG